ncbi:hypothetical protein GY15_21240 [Delftia sp. 670]|nr:hypothetical protein GY15_21240 [Delftia sp. 670]
MGMIGPQNAGKVMAWVGIAMYGAYAAGAPAGVAVQAAWGFSGIAVATIVLPLAALAMVWGLRATPLRPSAARRSTRCWARYGFPAWGWPCPAWALA